jgi:cysteinyl-tRNA synthetase
LIDKGYAYEVDGDVYYRAKKFAHYGELSHQPIDELEVGASQHVDEAEFAKKEDPIDFALWKAAKPDEISWDSPWGPGRPGWHIECSVMSTKYLGDHFDIHGGGQDLTFPHHENEIAQSEAKTGQTFANYWMHNGFVTVGDENEKMSKSLGNFVTVHDIIKEIDPQVIRFFMATTQYRRPIQYNHANIVDAQNNLAHIQTTFENLKYREQDANAGKSSDITQDVQDLRQKFVEAMDDDFNVQNAITVVYELVKQANVYSQQTTVLTEDLHLFEETLTQLISIFGVQLKSNELDDTEIEDLIEQRNQARRDKNFARSDEIRDQLKAQGIILEDTPQGTRYRKV